MYWDELGDSGSSEEVGLHFLYHFFNNYNTGDYPTYIDTTSMETPTSSPGTTKSTTEIPTSTEKLMLSTTLRTPEKTTESPPSTTTTSAVATTRQFKTTDRTSKMLTETTAAVTTSQLLASTTEPTTTAYPITTEDTFIEGDLNGDENVNKTDLNSTNEIRNLVDEYNDYIDEGPTRGDLFSTRSRILPEVKTITSGSGIIDASLSNMKMISDVPSNKKFKATKQPPFNKQKTVTPTDVSFNMIGNVLLDKVIQSLNNKQQTRMQKNSGDLTSNDLGNSVTTSLPIPTVLFTLPGAINRGISDSQQKLLSERVAKIGNDFVILPDFNNGAVLLEPIVSSGKFNTNTIPDFEYVPPKTLSFETIPKKV